MTPDITAAVPPRLSDDDTIWRYSDFTKFVALLETRALFFPRVGSLEDPFEGSFPVGQTVLDRVMGMLPGISIPPDEIVEFSPGFEQTWPTIRAWALVSCWHLSTYESAAMWRLYAPTGAAVAIRSTVGRLRRALGEPPPPEEGFGGGERFLVDQVEYIDYSSGRIPPTSFASQLFRKRRSFEHEREVRALLIRYPILSDNHMDHGRIPNDLGMRMTVDLPVLLDAVRVAPQAAKWYADLVGMVCRRYGLDVEPLQSELDAAPLY